MEHLRLMVSESLGLILEQLNKICPFFSCDSLLSIIKLIKPLCFMVERCIRNPAIVSFLKWMINNVSTVPWWLRQWRIRLQCRRPGFHPWVGKIPWRRAWQSTPVFLPGESPWTEEAGGSMVLQRVGHDWMTKYTGHNKAWYSYNLYI